MRILIVDDDPLIRKGLRIVIERGLGGCIFHEDAANGQEALQRLEAYVPDILITDVRMPIMDGIELIDRLRQAGSEMKAIVLSGYDEYRYIREALKGGAVDYLLKPVDNDELIELLHRLKAELRRGSESRLIEEARAFIRSRFRENIDLQTVADHLYLSASYFSDRFSKETGVTFTDYVKSVRVGEAKRLLAQTRVSVAEIGRRVGYEEPTTFLRAFKKVTGVSPSSFRK